MTFTEKDTVIELPDDGLRLVRTGNTKSGDYSYSVQENPALVAEIAYVRKKRAMIKEANVRKFT